MKITQLNSTLREVVQTNSSLSSYLRNLRKGRPCTPRSWLYENVASTKDVLDQWIPIMEKANLISPIGNLFNQFDLKQKEKFGPQGCVPPVHSKEAMEVIEPLYENSVYDSPLSLEKFFNRTQEFAKVLFGPRLRTKRPLSFQAVVDDMRERDTLTTNSGFPRFRKRNVVKQQEISDAESGKAWNYPAIILFRQYNGKLRPVWMYPMSLNLIGMRYQQLIQAELRKSPTQWVRDYLSPWEGYEPVKQTLTKQWPHDAPVIGGDTTKMDAHMRKGQIRLVFEIVKWLFQENYWDELWKSMEKVNTIDLLIGPDEIIQGDHGLASGAEWTQITETVLQMFMAWLKGLTGQGIGDDFYWLSSMSADDLVAYLAEFGLPANAEKQSVSNNSLTFLQRLNHQGFFSREQPDTLGSYYPTIRALNSSLNPEKFHKPKDWNSNMFCVRQYMILENCVDNPCFDEFLKFVVNGQKDLIPFAKKTDDELAQIQQQSRLIPGLNPSYNQEKRDKPLSTFVSIQLARQM